MQKITLFVAIFLMQNIALGASVSKLFKKERFKIDAGSDLGVAKGDKICSYTDSGEEAACGQVFKVKSSFAYVKVSSKESFANVVVAQAVKIEKNGVMVEITNTDQNVAEQNYEKAIVSKLFSKQRFKINAGSSQGLRKKDIICVYNSKNKRVGCGKVFTIKPTVAYLKVKKKKQYDRIKEGYVVRVRRGKIFEDILTNTSSENSASRFRIRLAYAPGVLSLYEYNAVEFPATGLAANDSTFYNLIGVQLNAEYFFTPAISLSLGVRYRSSPTDQVLTGNEILFQENDTSASDIAILIDSYLFTIDLKPLAIRFGTGINYDMSTVNFKSVEVNEATGSNDQVFSGSSSLNVLALRGLIDVRYLIGMWSIGLGTDLEIPLVELSKNTTIDDEVSEDELAEFEDTLGHTKSSFGLGFLIDVAVTF